jgi:hypothetical protein
VRLTTSPRKKIYLLRCPSHFSVKVLLIEKPHPSLKGPRKGTSLLCSPKWGPYGNIKNEFPFFGYGQFLGEGLNSKFFFDFRNTVIYIAIYIY